MLSHAILVFLGLCSLVSTSVDPSDRVDPCDSKLACAHTASENQAHDGKLAETPGGSQAQPQEDHKSRLFGGFFSGSFSTAVQSRHVKPGGRIIGGSTAAQRLSLVRTNNLVSGDELRGLVETDFDITSGKPSAGTFGIEYGNKTSLFGRVVSGYTQPHFGDRLSVGYQHWRLSKEAGEAPSHYVYGRWHHFSRAHWALTGMYGLQGRESEASGLVDFRMSKSWAVPGTSRSTYVAPVAGVAYAVNWFGTFHDGTVMFLGFSLLRQVTERLGIRVEFEGAQRLSGNPSKIQDSLRIGLGADITL